MKLLGIALLAAAPVVVNPTPRSPCLRLEPATETLAGRLELMTFPDYEHDSRGDRLETSVFIRLAESRCVEGARSDDLTYEREGTALIQLAVSSAQFARCEGLVGKVVSAVGRVFPARTTHHHTPVLLNVSTLSEVK